MLGYTFCIEITTAYWKILNSNTSIVNLNQISKEDMIKCVKYTHIINKLNLNFMGEEEIVAAEKKCEAIWDYCFSNSNTPKYLNKMLNYETKIENKEKKHFRE